MEQGQQIWTVRRTFLLLCCGKSRTQLPGISSAPHLKGTSSCGSWNRDLAASETTSLLMTVGQLGHELERRCGRVVERKGNSQGNGPGYVDLGHDGGGRTCWGSLTGSYTSVCGIGSGTCHKKGKLSAARVPENDRKRATSCPCSTRVCSPLSS